MNDKVYYEIYNRYEDALRFVNWLFRLRPYLKCEYNIEPFYVEV